MELERDHEWISFFAKTKEPVIIRSSCGRVLWATDEASILIGINSSLIGLSFEQWLAYLPDNEREIFRNRHRKAIAGLDSRHTFDLIHESGSLISVESKLIPFGDGRNEVVEWFKPKSSLNEMTIRNHDYGQLRLLKMPKEHVRSSMMTVAHEFRTPMTGLLGFTQLLSEEVDGNPRITEYVTHIRNSADAIIQLIESSLEVSSLESGCLENYPRFISLSEVVRPVIDVMWKEAKRREIYLQVKWPQNDHVFMDRTILATLVRNLIDNAVKFTITGGVKVEFKVTQNQLRIQVKDTGIGIEPESLPHVFQTYWQESQGVSRRYRGIGVGLSIVKGYVDVLKGTIRLQSTKGEGTTVNVEIPMLQSADEIDFVEFTQSKRILYVEDDPVIQLLSRRILKDYMIDTCFTGEEALERLKSVTYDAFILDIQLGKGMTGKELAEVLRGMSEYKSTPIAAATALNYDLAMLSDGKLFTHYLPKPFNRDQMLDLVTSMIGAVR